MDLHLYVMRGDFPHHVKKIDLLESNSEEADFRIMDLDVEIKEDQMNVLIGDSCGHVIEVGILIASFDSKYRIVQSYESAVLSVAYYGDQIVAGTNKGDLHFIGSKVFKQYHHCGINQIVVN